MMCQICDKPAMEVTPCSCLLSLCWSFMTVADENHFDEAIADFPVLSVSVCG
jgi:hypothetical protein